MLSSTQSSSLTPTAQAKSMMTSSTLSYQGKAARSRPIVSTISFPSTAKPTSVTDTAVCRRATAVAPITPAAAPTVATALLHPEVTAAAGGAASAAAIAAARERARAAGPRQLGPNGHGSEAKLGQPPPFRQGAPDLSQNGYGAQQFFEAN